ncbi:hypothetical protein Dsin_018532 [Dipteronia sinensis]|uniref:DUF4216 domain-containing protein n=1 Tax=Dipteronia sinensis TaxID=43782 RepID=A0AAE0A5N8_9ROSI|nr:hypothetical protein Dsin_018532 [Dipteronia sinensis]
MVDYHMFQVPIFKCEWANIVNSVKIDEGFVLVNLHKGQSQFAKDPFILASQAKQVFYCKESDTSHWSKRFRDIRLGQQIRHTTGRRGMKLRNCVHQNEIEELCSSECPPNDSCIKEDAIAKVLGREKRGQVRGATPSRVDAQLQSGENVKLLEAKLKVTNDELSSLREMVAEIMKQNEHLHNRIAMKDAVGSEAFTRSHTCTSQVKNLNYFHLSLNCSQYESVPMAQDNSPLENARCQLLHWYLDDGVGDQVVAEERIASTDPKATLNHMPLGKGYWKVWVDMVYEDINLCQPTDEHGTLNQAIGSTVAWINDCIKLL